jgi:membrane protein YdbS with pleckstrin-like domain
MNQAMLIGAIIMALTALLTLFILPSQIRYPDEYKGAVSVSSAAAAD